MLKVAALLGVEDASGSSRQTRLQTTLLDLRATSIRQACHHSREQVEARQAEAWLQSQALDAHRVHRRASVPQDRVSGSMQGFWVRFEDAWAGNESGCVLDDRCPGTGQTD